MSIPDKTLARLSLLAPFVAVWLVYWPALDFGYVWDDVAILVNVPQFRQWETLWSASLNPFIAGVYYFRPIPLLTLGLEQIVGRESPWLPHFDTILLHALNSVLVARLAQLAAARNGPAGSAGVTTGIAAGLLYALHPALIESGAWISVRFDSLTTLFCLAALLCDRVVGRTALRVLAVSALCLLGLLSKEMTFGWILTLPLWHLLFAPAPETLAGWWQRSRSNGNLAVYAGVAASVAIYLLLRWVCMGANLSMLGIALGSSEHLGYILRTLGRYVILSLVPFLSSGPMHAYQPQPFGAEAALGLAALAALPVLLWWSLRRPQARPMLLPLAFVVCLVPVLNIVPLLLADNYVHERFLTLPLAFLAIGGGMVFSRALQAHPRRRIRATVAALVGGAWLALCLLNLQVTLPLWRSELTFWTWAHQQQPESLTASVNLMRVLVYGRHYTQAHQLADELRTRQGGKLYADQKLYYAKMLAAEGRSDEAIQSLEEALAAIPAHPQYAFWIATGSYHLGTLYLERGDLAMGVARLRFASRINPQDAFIRYQLALGLLAAGEQEGEEVLRRALDDLPAKLREPARSGVEGAMNRFQQAAAKYANAQP